MDYDGYQFVTQLLEMKVWKLIRKVENPGSLPRQFWGCTGLPEGPKSSWSLFSSSSRTMDNFTGIGIYVLPVLIAFLTLASSIRDIRQHSVHHLRHQGFYTAHQDSVFFQLAVKSGTDKVTQTKDSGASGHAYEGLYTKVRCMHVSIMSPICVHIHSNRSGSRTVLLP